MGEMMFAQSYDQCMGVLGKKRPQIMLVDAPQFQTWKNQKTSLNEETEVGVSSVEMRRAMLKARFADTILKATLELQGGNSSDVSSLQQQIRPPLVPEKHHHTHKARTRSEAQIKAASQYDLKTQKTRSEAQIKASEAASQRKAQYDLKKRRQAEREAARMALQEMEKSVYVDEDAASIMRDFEKLIRGTGLGYPNTKRLDGRS